MRSSTRFAALLLLLGLVFGCTPVQEDTVVMTLGTREVLLAEFQDAFWVAMVRDSTLGPDEAGVRKFAERYVDEELIQIVAEETVGELEPIRQERLDEFVERTVIDKFRDLRYGDAFQVTDRELEEAYEKLGRRVSLRWIVVASLDEATEIRRATRQGAVFGKIARERSLDTRTRDSGGQLGWLLYTDLEPGYRDEIFALRPGELTKPVPRGIHFALFQVEEETENLSRGTLEVERLALETGIRQTKVMAAKSRYEEGLLEKFEFTYDPVQIAWMTVYMREKTDGAVRGSAVLEQNPVNEDGIVISRGGIPWTGYPVALADTGRVLATFTLPRGEVSPILVFDQLVSHPVPTWPIFETGRDVEKLIRELVLERLEVHESFAEGLEDHPDVVREKETRRRVITRRQYIRTEIRNKVRPGDEELRAYYDSHLGDYSSPETRRFVAMNVSTLGRAEEIARRFRSGESLEELRREAAVSDTSFRSTGSEGTPPMEYGQSPALDEVLFNIDLNAVTDPIPVGTTFTVAKVVEIIPASVESFEDVRIDILKGMVNVRTEARLEEIREEARVQYPVTIDREALRKIRFP